jgi:hypothetical protein
MRKDGASQAEFGMTMPSRGRADWKKSTPMKEKRMEQRSLVWRTLPSFDGNGAGLPHSTWSPGAIHLQCAPDSTHHKPFYCHPLLDVSAETQQEIYSWQYSSLSLGKTV